MPVLQESVMHLEVRVARLEEALQQLIGNSWEDRAKRDFAQFTSLTQTQLIQWLQAQGVIRTPTPEEVQLASEWEELPEQVKQEHIHFMQHLDLQPSFSQLVLENRR